MTNIEAYRKSIKDLRKMKLSFTVKEYGMTREVLHSTGEKQQYLFGGRLPGMHIPFLVRRNIEQKVRDGQYTIRAMTDKIHTACYDADNIERDNGCEMFGIDINSCYFNTAYLLGMIDDKIYKTAFKKNGEYKLARNISIGAMGTIIYEKEYVDGKLENKKEYYRSFAHMTRIDVIQRVWQVAQEIIEKVRDGFYMFLTDCFYVHPEYENRVYELLTEYGYDFKSKRYKLIDIYSTEYTDKVVWHDFEKEKYMVFSKNDKKT